MASYGWFIWQQDLRLVEYIFVAYFKKKKQKKPTDQIYAKSDEGLVNKKCVFINVYIYVTNLKKNK